MNLFKSQTFPSANKELAGKIREALQDLQENIESQRRASYEGTPLMDHLDVARNLCELSRNVEALTQHVRHLCDLIV
jgi:hypothetical protein